MFMILKQYNVTSYSIKPIEVNIHNSRNAKRLTELLVIKNDKNVT